MQLSALQQQWDVQGPSHILHLLAHCTNNDFKNTPRAL